MEIQKAVAERIAKSGEEVAERVVQVLVEDELSKRTKQIVAAYTEGDRLTRDLRRVNRPDIVSYGPDRKPVHEAYSKARLDEIEKITSRLTKVDKAITTALSEGNYDLLNKLGDGKSSGTSED